MIFWKTTSEIKSKEGVVHFKRFCYFSCKWFGIYKHIITQADKDRHEHDHPWDFWSFILEGGYAEYVNGELQARDLFSLKYNKAEFHHKLAGIIGTNDRCVTLVVTGPRRREWGYRVDKTKDGWLSGWINHKAYRDLKRSGILPD